MSTSISAPSLSGAYMQVNILDGIWIDRQFRTQCTVNYEFPSINIKNTSIFLVIPTPSILSSMTIDISPEPYAVEIFQNIIFFIVPELTCFAIFLGMPVLRGAAGFLPADHLQLLWVIYEDGPCYRVHGVLSEMLPGLLPDRFAPSHILSDLLHQSVCQPHGNSNVPDALFL